MQAMGTKTFGLEQLIALQSACIGSWSMINYGTHVTIKIGHKVVKEYFNIANVEHYNTILGTPCLRKMRIILDFRSLGTIQMGNKVVLTRKAFFNLLKDTHKNIAAMGNMLEHIWLYAYMHKVNPNIFQYFLRFSYCITFPSLFTHCDNFSYIFPYFSCCSLHLKSLSFQHGTLICFRLGAHVPAHHVESNYIICYIHIHLETNFLCIEWNQNKGQLWDHMLGQGICMLRHTPAFLSSLIWPSLRWEPIFSFL